MKPQAALRHFLLLSSSALLAVTSAHAATLYWDSDSTTAGFGNTNGTWGTDTFWSTVAAGTGATANTTTTSLDDLNFGTATDGYTGTVTVDTTRLARLLTFGTASGSVTLTGSTVSLGTSGGITVAAGAANDATISSNLTIDGAQTFNIGSLRTLTLSTDSTFTRNAGAVLNIRGAGTVTSTMTNLASGSMVNGIIGPWASFGTGATTQYATFSGNNIVGLTGTTSTVAAIGNAPAVNYEVSAAGTLGANASINTLRYTGSDATIAGALTTKGIMNVGGGTVLFSGAMTSVGEMVTNTANGNITFTGVLSGDRITKTGSGMLYLNGSAANNYTGTTTINGGVLRYANRTDQIGSGNLTFNGGVLENYWTSTIAARALGSGSGQIQILGGESGFSGNQQSVIVPISNSEVVWGSSFFNPSVFVLGSANQYATRTTTLDKGIDLNGATRTIASHSTTSGSAGVISGAIRDATLGTAGITKTGVGRLILSGTNTYTGINTISAGILQFAKPGSLYNSTTGSWTATNIVVANGGTLALNVGGAGQFTTGNVTTLLTNLGGMNGTSTTGFAAGSSIGFDTTGGTFSVADNISDSTGTGGGAMGVVKLGTGTLNLNGDLSGLSGSVILADGTLGRSSGNLVTTSIEAQNGTVSANIGGSTAVSKTTAGTVILSGANTYSGGFTLNAGQINNVVGTYAGFGGGLFTVNGTTGNLRHTGNTTTISNNVKFNADSRLSVDRAASVAPVVTWTGDVELAGNATFSSGGATSAVSSIFEGDISGDFSLTFNATRTNENALTLSGNNTFSGGLITTGAGVLYINSATALGTGTFIHGGGGNLDNTSGSAITLSNNNVQNWNSNFTFGNATTGTTRDLNMGTGNVSINGNRTVTVNAGKLTVGGNISGEFSFTKAGAGTLTLTGTGSTFTNSASGAITVNGGVLEVMKMSNGLQASSIGNSSNATTSLKLGGTLRYIGTGDDTDRRFEITGAAPKIESSGDGALKFLNTANLGYFSTSQTGILTLGGSNIGDNTMALGLINSSSGVLSLNKEGDGKWILSGNNNYSGGTTITAGTLAVGSANAVGASGTLSMNGGTLQFSASNTTDYSARLRIEDGKIATFNTSSQTVSFASALATGGSATGGLTKTGLGTLTLAGNNTYSGGTTINAGTLSLTTNATAAGSGGIAVSGSSAILSIASDITIANNITVTDAGASVVRTVAAGGAINVGTTGSLKSDLGGTDTTVSILAGTSTGGGTLTMGFNDTTSASPDWIRRSDIFSLSGTGSDAYVMQIVTSAGMASDSVLGWENGEGLWEWAVNGNTGNNATPEMKNYMGSFTAFQNFAATTFSLSSITDYIGAFGYDANAGGTGVGGVWAVLNHNSDFAAIPEPTTALAGLLLGAGLLRRRRAS